MHRYAMRVTERTVYRPFLSRMSHAKKALNSIQWRLATSVHFKTCRRNLINIPTKVHIRYSFCCY
jgi:hypothetical protein